MIDAIQARTNAFLVKERKEVFLNEAFRIIEYVSLKGERSVKINDFHLSEFNFYSVSEQVDKVAFFRSISEDITRQGFTVTLEKEGGLLIEW